MKKSDNKKDNSANEKKSFFYVAIGASAGGLEAIETFFTNMPENSGLGFIVIQHLSPDYKSLMVELLSKKTKMPVHRAEDGMLVLPDNVYLIPPKKNITIFHGKILLTDQDYSKGINLPIDIFLRSLAEDQGEKAIAVILSGTGSDGTRGVRTIKEFGGMVIVQNEESAKFDGMPRAAISTGLADFILAPEDMPAQILSFVKYPLLSQSLKTDAVFAAGDEMSHIFAILRDRCKVDFTFYKPSTVNRRIERRITVTKSENLKDYLLLLKDNPNEVNTLFRELLIGVTSFFRDQSAFDYLESVAIKDIIKRANNKEIRLWVTGCSTGEEAYSLAILFREAMEELGVNVDIKIFATDIDKEALQFASAGSYPDSVAADLPPRILAKYFYKKDEHFQIIRNIREMVVFAQHNLIKDPPFTNIDMISCRNLLIYLQPVLQKKILEFFNFSLKTDGVLFLGTSETIGDAIEYFEPLDQKLKIYRSKGKNKLFTNSSVNLLVTDTRSRTLKESYSNARFASRIASEDKLLERFIETISGDILPLTIVVNEHLEVQHIIGDTEGYFKLPAGKISNDITKMASKDLAIPISTGIQKVLKEKKEVRFSNIRLQKDDKKQTLELRIKPLVQKKGQSTMAAILLYPVKEEEQRESQLGTDSYDLSLEAEQRIKDLESELQFSRENLQATIEELETSNEELQATNEELLASNEELQSTNEELQSTNEELFTVNAEYHSKIIELSELHNDVDNLLTSSHIGTLLLDENLDIRKFSPQAASIFKLLSSDIGRPITHISHNISSVDPILLIKRVQFNNVPESQEIILDNGLIFLMRIIPYKIGPKVFSGVVVSFIDINDIKKVDIALKESDKKYLKLFETMAQGVVYQASDGRIISANQAAERMLGLTLDQMMGRTSFDPRWRAVNEDMSELPGEEHPSMVALRTSKEVNNFIMGVFNPKINQLTWIKISAVPLFKDGESKPYQVYATFDDITDIKVSEAALIDAKSQYETLIDQLPYGFALHEMLFDEGGGPFDYRFIRVNKVFEEITGLKSDRIKGKTVLQVIPDIETKWIEMYGEVVTSGKSITFKDYNRSLNKHFEVKAFNTEKNKFITIFTEKKADL